MQISVNLQSPFSYSIYPIIIILIIVIIYTIYLIIKANKKSTKEEVPTLEKVEIKDVNAIQKKYINKLNTIEADLDANKISVRKAYQELSTVIRHFVYEVTDIKVQYYTLREIKKLNMPILYELIQEYYIPEFSKYSIGNIKESIEKTRKVIQKWN